MSKLRKQRNHIYPVSRKKGTGFRLKYKSYPNKTYDTHEEAEKALLELQLRELNGDMTIEKEKKWSFNRLLDRWREKRNLSVSEGWIGSQEQMLRDYIVPFLNNRKLEDIKASDIDEILMNAQKLGRSYQTLLHIYNVLNSVFNFAFETLELIPRSPVKKTLKPKKPLGHDAEKKENYLEYEDVLKLVNYINGKSYEMAILLGLYLGLRAGEIVALEWSDIDFQNERVSVTKSYDRKMGRINNHTKTKTDLKLPIPPELMLKLRQQYKTRESEFVATSRRKKGHLSYDGFFKAIKRYCRELGVREISPHGLRHSCTGLYLRHKASTEDIKHLLNHRNIKTTLGYIHNEEQSSRNLRLIVSNLTLQTA